MQSDRKNVTARGLTPETPLLNTDGSPKMAANQQHHFHFNAWIKANYEGFEIKNKRVAYPCIELTNEQHHFAHKAGEDWLKDKYGKGSAHMGNTWLKVGVPEMDELANVMIAAANAHGANIDDFKINRLKNLCGGYLRTYNKKKCPTN